MDVSVRWKYWTCDRNKHVHLQKEHCIHAICCTWSPHPITEPLNPPLRCATAPNAAPACPHTKREPHRLLHPDSTPHPHNKNPDNIHCAATSNTTFSLYNPIPCHKIPAPQPNTAPQNLGNIGCAATPNVASIVNLLSSSLQQAFAAANYCGGQTKIMHTHLWTLYTQPRHCL